MLLVASYVFYGFWDWRFLGLILLSTVVDYAAGLGIARSNNKGIRQVWLWTSICTNLGLLGFFKYFGFFVENALKLSASLGVELDSKLPSILLPVGISFYTFQTMSYTIDIYRGKLQPTRNILDFALFVAFFPQLVAGPIERACVLLPQLIRPRRLSRQQLEEGSWLILTGFYLKCVLADNLTPFTEAVFGNPEQATGFSIVVGIYAAAFQIYGDFAGYSRIAIGVSKLLGIDLMANFDRPYLAISPSDFWKRWHISLSTWLRDYLYIPLGGNRGGSLQVYRNLMITMLLGGLWHGAAWNFIAWGGFHGAILCLWRWWEMNRSPRVQREASRTVAGKSRSEGTGRNVSWIRILAFFHVSCFGWFLFFVTDLRDIPLLVSNCLFHWEWNGRIGLLTIALFAGPVILVEAISSRVNVDHLVLTFSRPIRLFAYSSLTMAICLCGAVNQNEFIYFQF
ncbi:MAG: MBOAT family O-acyltransferase [Pirellulaceae bacterium]